MPIYQLERKQTVSLGLEECWRFFSDPRNLEKITPPSMNFTIKSALPPEVYPGLMIEYTVSPLLGIPLTWLTEIVHVDAPHRFVDEQRVGPYRIWHHEHSFRALPRGRDRGARSRDLCAPARALRRAPQSLSSFARSWSGFSIIGGNIFLRPWCKPRLDPAGKTALPNGSPTPGKGSAFWNSKISKPSSI